GHLHQGQGLPADVQHLAEPAVVMADDSIDATGQILDGRLVAGQREPYAGKLPHALEGLQIELEAAEGRDRGGRLMRGDAREHVIRGEKEIVDLEADLPRAVAGRVVHAIAVDEALAILPHGVDVARLEEELGT